MPTLMVQGTTSDAGKSTLVAAICRCLKRRGLKVAPFKPQNMALNSAVTADGGEIGRAQALQAQACGIAPTTDMNPILLKPCSDTGAQVIVHGKAKGNMTATSYHDYKQVAIDAVLESHERLRLAYDFVIVEGAGSPAEINLRDHDIANMGFAEAVDCPVIIVADIDKGGVFAHLTGTLDLLSPSEQARVTGFVINRFRGDISLLTSGLDWLEERTGRPVLGVLPYLHGLHLDAEDAIASNQSDAPDGTAFRVIVPVLPRISNHTDFDALQRHPDVEFRFVRLDEAMPPADLVIMPGSKSVRDDLEHLRVRGWEQYLQRHLRYGGKVLGVCGGYQMLGKTISDPEGVEGKAGVSTGFGLLDCATVLKQQKTLQNLQGRLCLLEPDSSNDASISGYEIHVGETTGEACARPMIRLIKSSQPDSTTRTGTDTGKFGDTVDGAVSPDGQIAGTYWHGVFDTPDALSGILAWAGLETEAQVDLNALREVQLERLADAFEAAVNVEQLIAMTSAFKSGRTP